MREDQDGVVTLRYVTVLLGMFLGEEGFHSWVVCSISCTEKATLPTATKQNRAVVLTKLFSFVIVMFQK